jgi:type I restriction enzyme S subunit
MELKLGYKQTAVGEAPEDWEVTPLASIGSFSKGQGIRKNEAASGHLPCIRYGEIYTHHNDIVRNYNSFISPEVARSSKRLSKGDLLFAGSGETKAEIGKAVAYIGEDEAYAGGDIVIFSPVAASSEFLGYLLNSPIAVRQKSSKGQGDAVVHISAAALGAVVVTLPPLPEQRAIATALSDVDALVAGLDRLIAKKRDLKQAAMQQLLTGQTRLPGFQGKWEAKRLGDMAELNRQNVVPASQPNQPFVHFSLPAFDAGAGAQVELGATIGSNKFGVPRNAVLVSKLNPRIPRVWAPEAVSANACASTEWLVLTPREGIERKFLFVVCCSSEFSGQMALAATGTTGSHQRISPRTALDIRLRVPVEQVEQIAIAAVLSDMDAELSALEARREKTRALKQGMMQELLTGRTRLV